MVITVEQLQDLIEAIEDTVQHICDEHTISGEMVWSCTSALSEAKLCEIRGEAI